MPCVGIELVAREGAVCRVEDGELEGIRVFARGLLPGERGQVRIDRLARRFATGTVLSVEASSPERRAPDCAVADRCGGCAWRHAAAGLQRAARVRFVRAALGRVLGEATPRIRPWPHPYPGSWRHRARLQLGPTGLSYRAWHSRSLVYPERCPALHPELDSARRRLGALLCAAGLKEASVVLHRGQDGAGRWRALASVRARERVPIDSLPRFLSGMRIEDPRGVRVLGAAHFAWPLPKGARVRFRVGGFTQADPIGNARLVTVVSEHLEAIGAAGRPGLELYAGAGNLSTAWPAALPRHTTIELDPAAAALQGENLAGAQPHHDPRVANLEGGLPPDLRGPGPPGETVLLDPPREGARAIGADLARRQPRALVYVSCDPSTLGRDLALLVKTGYRATRCDALDLFGATPHVETVVSLVRHPGNPGAPDPV